MPAAAAPEREWEEEEGREEEEEAAAAICLLQGAVVFRSPGHMTGRRMSGSGSGIGPIAPQAALLPQELLSMQSLGRDILSQLDPGSHSKKLGQNHGHGHGQGQGRGDRAAAAELPQSKERLGLGSGSVLGQDESRTAAALAGARAGTESEQGWYGGGDLEEDVLPRAVAPSPAGHWLGPSAPCLPPADSARPPASLSPGPSPGPPAPVSAPARREVRTTTLAADGEVRLPATAADSQVRLAGHREDILRHQQQMCDLTYRSPVAYHDSLLQSRNEFARPAFHSAKVRCHLPS